MNMSDQLINISERSYQNQVDDALNKHSNSLNLVMKALTVLTVCFLPFTVVSGFFGMNVRVPWQQDHVENLGPFFGIVGVCLMVSTIVIFTFKRLKWL